MAQSDGGDGRFNLGLDDLVLRFALSRGCGRCFTHPRGESAMSGELILALSYGLVLVAAGLWTRRRVLKDYRDDDD